MDECPSHEELAALLRDDLTDDASEQLVDHLGHCEACRGVLEKMSEPGEDWEQWEPLLRTARVAWPTLDARGVVPPSVERKPEVLGYEILGVLGSGGMGIVYKARHVALNRLVALKMLRSSWRGDPDFQKRFRGEAETLARLKHPNLVQIYDILEHEECPLLVLEYVDGPSLAALLREATLAPRDAAYIVLTAARAMQSAHEAGIVHRDLKPANILIRGPVQPSSDHESTVRAAVDGDTTRTSAEMPSKDAVMSSDAIKVTDFGIARCLETEGSTRTGEMMGTPSYMAPEQARGAPDWSQPAADVYALGAVLYEALTGRPPFRAESPYATMMQVVSEEPVPPAKIARGTSRDLETICMKCLRKDPSQRYASCEALANDLERHLTGKPISARRQPWWVHAAKSAKRHPVVASLSAATIVAVVVLLVVWTRFTIDLRQVNAELERKSKLAEFGQRRAQEARDTAEDRLFEMSEILANHGKVVTTEKELATPTLQPLRTRLLKSTLQAYQQLLERFEDHPRLGHHAANAHHRMGVLYRDLGDLNTGIEFMTRAIEKREHWSRTNGEDIERDSTLGVYLAECSWVMLQAKRMDESMDAARRAIRILEHEDVKPVMPRASRLYRLAVAYHQLSSAHHKRDLKSSIQYMEQAGNIIVESVNDPSSSSAPFEEQTRAHSVGGRIFRELGGKYIAARQLEKATQSYRQALELSQIAFDMAPEDPNYPGLLAQAHCCVAVAHRRARENQEALACFDKARQIRLAETERFPHVPNHRFELNMIHYTMGCIEADEANRESAAAHFDSAAQGHIQLVRGQPENSRYAAALCSSLTKLAMIGDWTKDDISRKVSEGLALLQRWNRPGSPAVGAIKQLQEIQAQKLAAFKAP